jgi:hypothetical protein
MAVETVDSVENFVFRTSPEDWMGFFVRWELSFPTDEQNIQICLELFRKCKKNI